MRRYLFLLFFVLFFCLTSGAEARKLAFLVGVDEYDNAPSLKCCVNDMKALKAALIKVGFSENDIFILTTGGSVHELPTKKKIEQRVAEILAAAEPNDLIFFAFSGHGAREGKTDYFCPPFADPDNLEGTCVSITKVMNDLSKCEASFKWMVVDACRNDSNNSRDAKAFQIIPAPPQGVALFQSCDKGEKSYEEKRNGGHGYFTKNLVAALSGEADTNHDGKLTLFEVCTWTAERTQAEVEEMEHKTQRPFLNLSVANFTLSENLNAPKANQLVEEARKAVKEKKYVLALKKYDEALALCPQFSDIKRERDLVEKIIELFTEPPSSTDPPGGTDPSPPFVESPPFIPPVQTPSTPIKAGARQVFKVNDVEFAFRYCPSGTYMMGSPISEDGRYSDEKQHEVTLSKDFWMLETEVTQKQWKAVMGNNPSLYDIGDDLPVNNISWNDCQDFCRECAQRGLPVRLPTEEQWEYACRAGSKGAYAGKLDEMAWYSSNSGSKSHPVATKTPNAWGLYDMHGNVWEWCQDWYRLYPGEIVTDPAKIITNPDDPSSGAKRIVRGGSGYYYGKGCRSASRNSYAPDSRNCYLGFRCVKD